MKKKNIFWGLIFIVASIFLIVSKLGYLPGVSAVSLVLTILLIAVIIDSIVRVSFMGILFPIAFICIIYNKELGLTEITPWTVLIAATLGSAGLSIIFKKKNKYLNLKKHDYKKYEKFEENIEGSINTDVSFSSTIKYINTNEFVRANLSCSFGSMKVYFDNAQMKGDEAIINLEASFSGVEIYIPKEWSLQNEASVAFGGIEEKNKGILETTKRLILIGDVSFSGVEIIYI